MKQKQFRIKSAAEQKTQEAWYRVWFISLCVGMLMSDTVMAQVAMEVGWDEALCQFSNAITGKTAIAISTIAFGAAGAGALWGEQMTGIMKMMTNVVVATGVLLGGGAMVNGIATAMGKGGLGC